jgi:GNAT superfamily N-acetyltransferase
LSRARAAAWRRGEHAAVSNRTEPWEHGTAIFTDAFPDYRAFNVVRLEHGDPDAETTIAETERLQAHLRHRRVEIHDEALGARLRPGFADRGWRTTRLVYMALAGEPQAPDRGLDLRDVPLSGVRDLRVEWGSAYEPLDAVVSHLPTEEAVADRLGSRVLAAFADDRPTGFCEWRLDGDAAEVQLAYVAEARRGEGIGGRLVAGAVRRARAQGATLVFIAADDEERARDLYARLGFQPVWTLWEMTVMPTVASP